MMRDQSGGPLIGLFYDNLVDKLFERIEDGFVDLVQQQQPDSVDRIKVERVFTHHI